MVCCHICQHHKNLRHVTSHGVEWWWRSAYGISDETGKTRGTILLSLLFALCYFFCTCTALPPFSACCTALPALHILTQWGIVSHAMPLHTFAAAWPVEREVRISPLTITSLSISLHLHHPSTPAFFSVLCYYICNILL